MDSANTRAHSEWFRRSLPAGYREELRDLLAERETEARAQSGSLLVFELGGQRLALPTKLAWAIAPVLHIARIPHRSGTVLLGLAAFRGEILPCCSLARLLDLPAESTGAGRTLILEEARGQRWAVPIDAVAGVRIMQEQPVTESSSIPAEWIEAVYRDSDGLITQLRPEILFRQIALATA